MKHMSNSGIFTKVRDILSAEDGLQLLIIYGSAATNNMRIDSDVDIAVLFDHTLNLERKIELVSRLENDLLRQIDLVDIATLSGTILRQVLCKGRILMQINSTILAEQTKKMIFNQADMMPYVSRTLMERQQRFING